MEVLLANAHKTDEEKCSDFQTRLAVQEEIYGKERVFVRMHHQPVVPYMAFRERSAAFHLTGEVRLIAKTITFRPARSVDDYIGAMEKFVENMKAFHGTLQDDMVDLLYWARKRPGSTKRRNLKKYVSITEKSVSFAAELWAESTLLLALGSSELTNEVFDRTHRQVVRIEDLLKTEHEQIYAGSNLVKAGEQQHLEHDYPNGKYIRPNLPRLRRGDDHAGGTDSSGTDQCFGDCLDQLQLLIEEDECKECKNPIVYVHPESELLSRAARSDDHRDGSCAILSSLPHSCPCGNHGACGGKGLDSAR